MFTRLCISRLQDPLPKHYPSTEAHHIDSSSASAHPHIVELKPPLPDQYLPKEGTLAFQYTPFPHRTAVPQNMNPIFTGTWAEQRNPPPRVDSLLRPWVLSSANHSYAGHARFAPPRRWMCRELQSECVHLQSLGWGTGPGKYKYAEKSPRNWFFHVLQFRSSDASACYDRAYLAVHVVGQVSIVNGFVVPEFMKSL
jgi:hypothetical protein